MTQHGTLGTPTRPTRIDTELLDLLNGNASRLVGLGIDARETDDGVIVFSGASGQFSGNAVVWINGTGYPVQSAEWVDGTGTRRPVVQWHLGPLGPGPPSAVQEVTFPPCSGAGVPSPTQATLPSCSGVGVPSNVPDTVTVGGTTLDRQVYEAWDPCGGPDVTLDRQVYENWDPCSTPEFTVSLQLYEDWQGETV